MAAFLGGLGYTAWLLADGSYVQAVGFLVLVFAAGFLGPLLVRRMDSDDGSGFLHKNDLVTDPDGALGRVMISTDPGALWLFRARGRQPSHWTVTAQYDGKAIVFRTRDLSQAERVAASFCDSIVAGKRPSKPELHENEA